ncbi:MAG: Holliday junction branch migration protein RuvA [Proteobacteria bacterium]|nr:Holliday junction branch migration protein RuvA [Pseudomonadota bacterium]
MISWLRGRVLNVEGNEVTINTGNIGYCVYLGENRLLQMGIQKDQEVELVVYTVVREDDIRLFGFNSFLSRTIFSIMLGVSGIGPKAATNIVDKLEPAQVIAAIQHGDYNPFLSISGIGKKTAQRIVLELQGKLDIDLKDIVAENIAIPEPVNQVAGDTVSQFKILEDAKSALSNLGFTEREADRVIKQHIKPGLSLDEIIRKSLAELRQ